MTQNEFKSWFEGFAENIGGAPTEAQWQRIKARVAEIDGSATTQFIFERRYVPAWPVLPYPYTTSGTTAPLLPPYTITCGSASGRPTIGSIGQPVNSASAFHSLGVAEAQAMAEQ